MKPFFDPARVWPPGQRVLELYVLPDLRRDHELAMLVAGCRDVFTRFPATDRPIPDEWLHVTVQPINDGAAEPLPPQARQELIAQLAATYAATPVFTTQVGSVLAYASGVVADLHDDAPFEDLVARARTTITAVCGPGATTYTSLPAHMALAYAHSEQDSDPVARALRRVRPGHAPMTVDAVHLVEVEQDPDQCVYRWTPVRTFALRGAITERRVA